MQLSKNKKIILIVGIILLILFIGFYIYLVRMRNQVIAELAQQEAQQQAEVAEVVPPPVPLDVAGEPVLLAPVTQQPKQVIKEDGLERISIFFVERFGSFSNQANFSNIEELYPFMTSRFKTQMSKFIAKNRAKKTDRTQYSGVNTRVLSTKIEKQTDELAILLIKTTRNEAQKTRDNSTNKIQDIRLNFKKVSGEWKVDNAVWQ